MQEAVAEGVGAMAAIIGLEADAVAALCQGASSPEGACQPANENGAGQIVVSGHRPAVEQVMAAAKQAGAKMCKLLAVSAPFHSALMQPAAEKLRAELLRMSCRPPSVPVIANVDAEPYPQAEGGDGVRQRLFLQVAGTVRWERCVRKLAALGATAAIEVGPGKVLSGLIKRIAPTIATYQFADPAGLSELQPLNPSFVKEASHV
jgi:[acyl-carrier-protein] S-malonyltransferase